MERQAVGKPVVWRRIVKHVDTLTSGCCERDRCYHQSKLQFG